MSIPSISVSSLFECDTTGGLVCKQKLKNDFIGYVINISHTHIDNICKLVIECQSKLLLKNFQKQTNDQHETNNYDTSQGFIVYEWSIDSLKKLLSWSTSLLLCIIDNNKSKLAGYQLLTPISNLIQYTDVKFGQLELDHSVITDEQWKQFISSPDVHYSEQTGVAAEYRGLGIGSSLIELAKRHSSKGICTGVIFWPYNNVASENFRKKNGFQPVAIWNQITCKDFVPFKSKIFIWFSVNSDL
jgi:GNAT superfamily N-acetyltransferase